MALHHFFWDVMPHRFVGFTGGGGIIGQVE